MAAIATFALKAGVWFRRGRLVIVSPDSLGTTCQLSGRNSTYRPVQISGTGSPLYSNATRVALPPASSVDEPESDQEENCTNGGSYDGGHDTRAKMDSQSGQEPIADEGADDADAKVRHEPKAGAPYNLAGKPACDQSDQQNN